jgi:hypothetical protein
VEDCGVNCRCRSKIHRRSSPKFHATGEKCSVWFRRLREWRSLPPGPRASNLFAKGNEFRDNTRWCPRTVEIIRSIPGAAHAGNVLFARFAVTEPGTHIVPHCAPHNARLRVHLGLKVPKGNSIRVGDEVRSWEEGRAIIFDDSFEHEVWNKSNARRIILLFDVWHPDMTQSQILAVRYSDGLMPVYVEPPKDQ